MLLTKNETNSTEKSHPYTSWISRALKWEPNPVFYVATFEMTLRTVNFLHFYIQAYAYFTSTCNLHIPHIAWWKKICICRWQKKKSHDITDSTLDNAGVTSALQSQYKPNFLLEIKILKILFEKKNEDARVTNLELVWRNSYIYTSNLNYYKLRKNIK